MHAVHPVPTTREDLLAFRISGRVEKDDMHEMAELANAVFDRHETVDILLIFENFAGRDTGGLFDAEAMKAQFRSLSNLGRYVVVGAPDSARRMIETMGSVIPVKAMTFDKGDEEKAWVELGARPSAE
jgi:hypothetical protein